MLSFIARTILCVSALTLSFNTLGSDIDWLNGTWAIDIPVTIDNQSGYAARSEDRLKNMSRQRKLVIKDGIIQSTNAKDDRMAYSISPIDDSSYELYIANLEVPVLTLVRVGDGFCLYAKPEFRDVEKFPDTHIICFKRSHD